MIIYTLGGGEVIYNVLQAVVLCLNGGGGMLQAFLRIGGFVGVIMVYFSMIHGNVLEVVKSWGIPVLLVMNMLFVPTTKVNVVDTVTRFSYALDHVPYGLAFFASHISSFSQRMTEVVEQNFSMVDDLKYHTNGMMFGSRILEQAKTFKITNRNFKSNFGKYVDQCVKYDIMLNGKYSVNDLENTNDIWGLITSNPSNTRGFFWDDNRSSNGYFVTCAKAVSWLDYMWKDELNRDFLTLGQKMFQGKLNHTQGGRGGYLRVSTGLENALQVEVKSHLTSTMQYLTDIATSAEETLKQAILINSFERISAENAEQSGKMSGYAVAKSMLSQNMMFKTVGHLAAKMLVVIYSVLQALVYACFMFVIPMCMIPNGYKFLINWVMVLVWLQLWGPLYAILNYVMNVAARAATITQIGTAGGLTIGNYVGVSDVNEQMALIAGYLSMSIPVIAMIITKGLSNFASLSGQVVSSSLQIAGQSAGEVVSGNLSLGNVSLRNRSKDNFTELQRNYNSMLGVGGHTDDTGTVQVKRDAVNNRVIFDRQISRGAVQSSANTAIAYQHYRNYQYNKQKALDIGKQLTDGISKAQSQTFRIARSFADKTVKDIATSLNIGEDEARQISRDAAIIASYQSDISLATQKSSGWSGQIGANLGFGLGKSSIKGSGSPFSISVGGSYAMSKNTMKSEGASLSEQATNSKKFDEAVKKFQAHLQKIDVSAGSLEMLDRVRDYTNTVQKNRSLASSKAYHDNQANIEVRQFSRSLSASIGNQIELKDTLITAARNRGYSAAEAEHMLEDNSSPEVMEWRKEVMLNQFTQTENVLRELDENDVYYSEEQWSDSDIQNDIGNTLEDFQDENEQIANIMNSTDITPPKTVNTANNAVSPNSIDLDNQNAINRWFEANNLQGFTEQLNTGLDINEEIPSTIKPDVIKKLKSENLLSKDFTETKTQQMINNKLPNKKE